MQFMLLLLAYLGYLARAKCSLNELPVHPGVGGLYKGPNSETIIKGPDGSVITAQEVGGSVATRDLAQPIVVADSLESVEPLISTVSVAPVVSSVPSGPIATVTASPIVTVTAAPIASVTASSLSAVAPVAAAVPVIATAPVGHTVEVIRPDPHIIETEIVDAPVVEPQQSSDLVGPSGSISTRGSSSIISGPASTTISEPAKVLVATPLVAAVPVISTVTTPLRAVPVVNSAASVPVASLLSGTVSTVTVAPPVASPQIIVSSTAAPNELNGPTAVNTLVPPTGILSTTLAPPRVWEADSNINARLSFSTPSPILPLNEQVINNQQISSNVGASIQPASTYGVINNLENIAQESSTPRPEISLSSTLTSPVKLIQNLGVISTSSVTDLDLINNRQLSINPSLIPSANIIPPEIGPLPPGAIDLGSTVTVSTTPSPPTPGVISPAESPNIQRLDSGNGVILENSAANINGRLSGLQISNTDQILLNNQVLTGLPLQPTSSPLPFTVSSPIPVGIPRNGPIGNQLASYRIHSSQIGLTNVPLSSASGLPQTVEQEIDEVSAQLWNRYGRDVKEKEENQKKNREK